MWPLSSLLPLWLATIVAGLPLRHSQEDISRFELGHGIGRPREHREVVPRLYHHNHPATTGPEAALGHLHRELHKRGIIGDARRVARTGYRQVREYFWKVADVEGCYQRKVGRSRRSWRPLVCMITETGDPTQMNELVKRENSMVPTAATLTMWIDICSTWETAHNDKKLPYVGLGLTEIELLLAQGTEPGTSGRKLSDLLDAMRDLPRDSPLREELRRNMPDGVRSYWKFQSYLKKLRKMKEQGRTPRAFGDSFEDDDFFKEFDTIPPGLLEQSLKYFTPGKNTDNTPAGRWPMMGGRGVMKPI